MKNNHKNTILSKFANNIVQRRLSVPCVFFLELYKPFTFIGSQLLHFFGPLATFIISNNKYYEFASLVEDRNNINFVLTEIEKLETKV